jgi:hypothetical protein
MSDFEKCDKYNKCNNDGFFRSDNGQQSYARLVGVAVITIYLLSVMFIVFMTAVFPDIPPVLAALLGGLYFFNKKFTKE